MQAQRRSAIIVGGGLSGLAAAFTLQQAGVEVRVLERLDRPGGRVLTTRRDGYVIDCGPDAATAGYREYLGLLDALGLGEAVVPSSGVIGVVRGGRVHDIDPQRPLAAAVTPALSLGAKFQLLRGAARIRRQLAGIDSFELVAAADRDDPAISAQQFAERHFGREVTDYLIDPAMRLTAGTGAAGVSQLGVLGALANWTAPLVNVRGGLDTLPRALAERVPVEYGAEVTQVEDHANGVRVRYRDAQQQEQTVEADHCVIGAMYHVARRIWAPLDRLSGDFGAQLKNLGLISISLGYRTSARSRAYVIEVPSCEYPDVLLMFMQQNKAPDRAPPGHSLLTLYTDGACTERYLQHSDAELETWAGGIAETLFPEFRGQRTLCEVHRWPHAGYLADPGFWRRSRALLAALPADGRVHLAGDLFGAGSMESAVRWGIRAAQRVLSGAARA